MQALVKLVQAIAIVGLNVLYFFEDDPTAPPKNVGGFFIVSVLVVWAATAFIANLSGWITRKLRTLPTAQEPEQQNQPHNAHRIYSAEPDWRADARLRQEAERLERRE
jgi:hypothetical protein